MSSTISNSLLYQAILFGADCVREKKEELNRINVFPVVDNDTGSNLAHTMLHIINQSKLHEWIRSTLRDIAHVALIGARGNSGAIFSQYLSGFYARSLEKSEIAIHELSQYFEEAYTRAYQALEKPVEGTILTLMRAWSASLKESLHESKPFMDHFDAALANIKTSLEETRTTLKENRQLGVVDAGALAFYYFIEGFVQVMTGRKSGFIQPERTILTAVLEDHIHHFAETAEIPYRYCTEILFESDRIDIEVLKSTCKSLGDSLLISSADNLHRIHIHTNEPWKIVHLTAEYGQIIEQKADDMVMQNLLAGPFEKKTACVTDSIADLPQSYLYEKQVHQIPLNVMIEDVTYLDKRTIDRSFLYDHLDQASSAQLNVEQIIQFLEPILAHYENVVILTVSSEMSGTHQRFKEALKRLDPNGSKTALIDTLVNSGAQGLLVRRAVQMIEDGLPFSQLVMRLEDLKRRAKILVSVLDIEPMARSGRVSEKIGDLLIKLKFKPLVTIDRQGKGTIRGIAFSDRKNWKNLIRAIRRKDIEEYSIVHADSEEKALQLKEEMIRMTGKEPLYITDISSVVTLFAGKGSIAAAFIESDKKNEGDSSCNT
jgi:DegV family protein with EDD domain